MKSKFLLLFGMTCLLLNSCGGGGTDTSKEVSSVDSNDKNCVGFCASSSTFLTQSDIELIISQAVAEAKARQLKATIAVTDRVGNVLAVFRMNGAEETITISSTHGTSLSVAGGLEKVNIIPDTMVAISKAVTGGYLSSEGNAFSTRTASQIIQETFNPGESNAPSGPLFGVQFSQLACNDFNLRFDTNAGPSIGPQRSPLGLSADPGGLPLYKAGTPVGAIGVISDGIYGLDKFISGFDLDNDELIALAGSFGFAAPLNRRGDVITIAGKTARFSDAFVNDLLSRSSNNFSSINNVEGNLVGVKGYYDGGQNVSDTTKDSLRSILIGKAFGQLGSGIIPADPTIFKDANGQSLDAYIFAGTNNLNRFPASAGNDSPEGNASNQLTQLEVQELLNQAIGIANKSRAQIRQPNSTQARVSVSVVDSNGAILGMARTRDAPIFGSDVSLQKARTAVFFSSTGKSTNAPADLLRALPPPLYIDAQTEPVVTIAPTLLASPTIDFSNYVSGLQTFLGVPKALQTDGPPSAFSDRSGGNLSRPNFPDGIVTKPPGPLSKPAGQWSVFSVGFQSDLIYNSLIQHVAFVAGLIATDVDNNCTGNKGLSSTNPFTKVGAINGLANGIQIFPGSVPIYRGSVLIGGIGVSGDGIDQDDMISFLALHQAGLALSTGLHNAPKALRADTIDIPNQSIRLRFVNCPQAPFINSNESEVCNGI